RGTSCRAPGPSATSWRGLCAPRFRRPRPPSAPWRALASRPFPRPRTLPSSASGSSFSFRSFHDLREAVEPLQPRADALERVGREHAPAYAADLLRRHELRLLEQPDVLLHPGERHAEGLGELADRRAPGAQPFEGGAAGRVGGGCKSGVDGPLVMEHSVHWSGP